MMQKFFTITFFLHATLVSFSQNVAPDTAFVRIAVAKSLEQYASAVEGQERFNNGGLYVEPETTDEGHPYFLSEDWLGGSIVFDGQYFDQLPLRYDLTTDRLVSEAANGDDIALVREKLSAFTLAGHQFEKLLKRDYNQTLPMDHFYEVLYNGRTRVVALRIKVTQRRTDNSRALHITFDEKNKYFVLRDNQFYPVRSKRSILELLGEKRRELKSYIDKNKIRFPHRHDQAIPAVAAYYDTLVNAQ